jgi:CheY-like chemotaxis protein
MKKILFFDDEPFIIGFTVKCLQEIYGWNGDKEIDFVSTVDELLDKINNKNKIYCLFVLDVMVPMPSGELKKQFSQQELDEMDDGMGIGLVMAKKIRQIERYTKIPVLFLSGRDIPNILDSEKDYTAYIKKPASAEEISKKMDELLAKTSINNKL